MDRVRFPLCPHPQVVLVARATHGDLPIQGWTVDGFWGVHLYRYHADLSIGGHRMTIEPGYAGFTPPGERAEYRFRGPSTHLFAHLRFPADAPQRSLPAVFAVGTRFPDLWSRLEEAVGYFGVHPERAEVRVWDVMFSVLEAADSESRSTPPPVWRTLEIIEQRMHEPLSVSDIAHEVGLSHNHLTRTFRAATGQSVVEAIQARRMERAKHLLQFSTMPVKQIALHVGMPDLQHFNKAVRRHLGASPRSLRG